MAVNSSWMFGMGQLSLRVTLLRARKSIVHRIFPDFLTTGQVGKDQGETPPSSMTPSLSHSSICCFRSSANLGLTGQFFSLMGATPRGT